MTEGTFRRDLFFRLNVIELFVPPLADRPDDILPLAEHFLARHVAKESRGPMKFGDDAVTALVNHEFSGNVRELQNRIQRAVLVELSDTITAGDLGLVTSSTKGEPGRRTTPSGPLGTLAGVPGAPSAAPPGMPARPPANDPASEEERAGIEDALVRAGGVVAKAAAEMGLSRQALYRRMERLGIVMERRPR